MTDHFGTHTPLGASTRTPPQETDGGAARPLPPLPSPPSLPPEMTQPGAVPPYPRLRLAEPEPHTCDDIANLFLGDTGLETDPSVEPRTTPSPARSTDDVRREGVILGHLPVLPAAWVSVYARTRAAATQRPVAVLHRRVQSVELDLCPAPSKSQSIARPQTTDDLESAIATAAEHRADWLVRVPELDEPDLAELAGLTDLTILTTAGEHALVATYRVLKTFAAALSAPGISKNTPKRTPGLRVAFFLPEGAPHGPARFAADRLVETAQSFLDVTPEYELIAARIQPSRRIALFAGGFEAPAQELIDAVTAADEAARAHRPARAQPEPKPQPNPMHAAEAADRTDAPDLTNEMAASIARELRGAAQAAEEQPAAPTNASSRASTDRPSSRLWATRLPGLSPLRARCPYAEDVEMATDDQGRLHLIADAHERAHGAPSTTPAFATTQLLNAAAWAEDHRSLLALTEPKLTTNPRADGSTMQPAMHLIVSSAPAIRPLIDTELRIHLVAGDTLLPLNA